MPLNNCKQAIDTSSFLIGDTVEIALDELTTSTFVWSSDGSANAAAFIAAIEALPCGGVGGGAGAAGLTVTLDGPLSVKTAAVYELPINCVANTSLLSYLVSPSGGSLLLNGNSSGYASALSISGCTTFEAGGGTSQSFSDLINYNTNTYITFTCNTLGSGQTEPSIDITGLIIAYPSTVTTSGTLGGVTLGFTAGSNGTYATEVLTFSYGTAAISGGTYAIDGVTGIVYNSGPGSGTNFTATSGGPSSSPLTLTANAVGVGTALSYQAGGAAGYYDFSGLTMTGVALASSTSSADPWPQNVIGDIDGGVNGSNQQVRALVLPNLSAKSGYITITDDLGNSFNINYSGGWDNQATISTAMLGSNLTCFGASPGGSSPGNNQYQIDIQWISADGAHDFTYDTTNLVLSWDGAINASRPFGDCTSNTFTPGTIATADTYAIGIAAASPITVSTTAPDGGDVTIAGNSGDVNNTAWGSGGTSWTGNQGMASAVSSNTALVLTYGTVGANASGGAPSIDLSSLTLSNAGNQLWVVTPIFTQGTDGSSATLEFTAPAGYDWPLIAVDNVTQSTTTNATSVQAGQYPYTTLYWQAAASAWETIGAWFRDYGFTIGASGYPGSVAGQNWSVYIGDGGTSGHVPAGPSAVPCCNALDTSAVTATNPYAVGSNVNMSNGSTLILGPSAGSSSVVFTGGIGNSVTVTVNANSICAPNGASNSCSYTLNDGSILAVVYNQGSLTTALDTSGSPATIVANTSSVVCGVLVDGTNTENGNTVTIYGSVTLNGSSAFLGTYINSGSAAASSNAVALNGPLTVNGSAVVLTVAGSTGSGNTLTFSWDITWDSNATLDLGDSEGLGGSLIFSGGVIVNAFQPLTIGDGNVTLDTLSAPCRIYPMGTTDPIIIQAPTAIFEINPSSIPAPSVRLSGVDGGVS